MVHNTPEMRSFLSQHAEDDTTRLLLSVSRYPGIDVRWAVEQIEARRQLRNKLPAWYAMGERLIMGGRIPAEQCSSEQTAQYKRQLVYGRTLCDLTGGMGVDCYYMSRGLDKAIYTERQHHLCEAAQWNFPELGADNIEVREGDAFELGIPDVDTLYLDPARRSQDGGRVYDLEDCEPNVVEKRELLLSHCKRLIVKISPMADLSRVMHQLPGITEIHVVAVKNECKELLLVLDQLRPTSVPTIHCIDFRTYDVVRFDYALNEENEAQTKVFEAKSTPRYLYEPDVTLFKAGVFRLPCQRYPIEKVEANSHLYVSDQYIKDFPGRVFEIDKMIDFSNKTLKVIGKQMNQANVSVRNFPIASEALKKRLGIKDGGEVYLFGTTFNTIGAQLLKCRKVILCLLILLFPLLGYARGRKNKQPQETVSSVLQAVRLESPNMWNQGDEFVYLNDALNAAWHPESPDQAYDTLNYSHTIWTFDGILSEEDWMGTQCMQLRFRSPYGRLYRFSTGRKMSQANDTTYHPALPGLCALSPVRQCNDCLKGRQLYLMINDERLFCNDSIRLEKFVPVTIDSVTVGNEMAPLRVWITHSQGVAAYLLTSLPGSRENATSTSIEKYFSIEDPYQRYPNITSQTWALIRTNKVQYDMTLEEVRLSLGRPQRYEHYNSKGGMLEVWHYADRLVVEFVDGRVRRTAMER